MLGARLLPCNRCGAWGSRGGLCSGCGAVSEGEAVGLDRCAGDGQWIHVERGAADELLAALARLAELGSEARSRAEAASRLVRHLAGPGLTLHLDLRPVEAGHVEQRGRRANRSETFYTLPWVVVRSDRGEARIVRRLHHKVRRSFGANRVNTQDVRFAVDELWLRTPAGTLRRPLLTPASLARVNLTVSDDAPGWGPLPATAPGGPASGALLTGLVAALLLLVAPFGLRWAATPEAYAVAATGLEVQTLGPGGVRAALAVEDVWTQRKALAAAGELDEPERLRLLHWVAEDPRRHVAVRLQAVDALAGEGAPAVSRLLDVESTLGEASRRWSEARRVAATRDARARLAALLQETTDVRAACLRALTRADRASQQRVGQRAERLLARADEGPAIKRPSATLLAASVGAGRRTERGASLLRPLLGSRSLPLRGAAGLALAKVAPERGRKALRQAFERTAAEAATQALGTEFGLHDVTLMSLAQALVLSGEGEWLRRRALTLTRPAAKQEALRLTQDS